MLKTFFDTRDCFKSYLNYNGPISYQEWMSLNSDSKVAQLFVQFFDEIYLAWDKATTNHTFYASDEEAVETVIQYLDKNVTKIAEAPKKFNPAYIYRVAYNCLYCICHDRLNQKFERENVISDQMENAEGDTMSWFDFIIDETADPQNVFKSVQFWSVVDTLDEASLELVDRLINSGIPKNLSKKNEELLANLRVVFAPFSKI